MISPGERFNAFSTNRLIKKEENLYFGSSQRLVLSPNKHALFLFIHLVNRSITNIPWVFWVSILATFIQIAIAVIQPFAFSHWSEVSGMKSIISVLLIILRYIPFTVSSTITIIIFVVYSILVVFHVILTIINILMLKNKKDTNLLIKIFFFYSYLFLPLFRSSIICIISEMVSMFPRNPTFGNFFLSLFALVILLLQFFMTGFIQLVMGSSPSPNLVNPLAIWGPCAWRSVIFEFYVCFIFMYLEFIRSIENDIYYAIVTIIFIIISVPHAIYQSVRTYYISYSAYEYIGSVLWCTILFSFIHLVVCFAPSLISYIALIAIWAILPIIGFIVMKTITNHRLKKALRSLDQCGLQTTLVDDNPNNIPYYNDDYEDDRMSSSFESLGLKNSTQAIFVARAACVTNHPSFIDLSFLQYCIDRFPKGMFFFVHLAFLVQNQQVYVQQLIDLFLEENKPTFLQTCVIFQILTSIQESSNDLPQFLVREIGKQKLQSMKCQQLLSKFWSSCYKGDVTQMSRHAFTLNKHINELSRTWRLLVLRYPFSTPVLKEYIQYLQSTGTQHKIVEAILKNHPQLNEVNNYNESQEVNMPFLHQAVEDAVDRRPIKSINKVRSALVISISIALLFLIFIIVVGFYFLGRYNVFNEFIYQTEFFVASFTQIPNMHDDVIFAKDSYQPRSAIFNSTNYLENSLNSLLKMMPDNIMWQYSRTMNPLYLEIDKYNATVESDFINSLRLCSYFSRSMSFVPINDSISSLVYKNILDVYDFMDRLMVDTIDGIEKIVNLLEKYAPAYYAANWALLFLVMIPLLYFSIKELKEELTYLFSIYLTIPRSTIMKFMDSAGGKQQDKKNQTLLLSTSFAHHTTTTNIRDDDDNETKGMNVADGFKMLVSDSSANISVLPRMFVFKATAIFFFLCGFIALLSTIGFILFVNFSKNLISCFHTQKVVTQRTALSSIVMHTITSAFQEISPESASIMIELATTLHTALLFKDPSYKLSSEALSDSTIVNTHSSDRCANRSDYSCRSLVSLFDAFTNQAANITEMFINGQTFNPSTNQYQNLREMYNKNLYPLLFEVQNEIFDFTEYEIYFMKIKIVIVLVVCFCVITATFFLFVMPVIREIDQSVESVKLPLKHINPLEITSLQKVLMYIQGESDFKRNGAADKGSESTGGNSILNVLMYPFAIFEDDTSLLFANNAFYSTIGTSRKAVIGLHLADIFASVLPFRKDESHPFNSLIDTVSQLQRGVAPVNVLEIRTELELSSHTSCPVMIRLIGICKTAQQEDEEETKQNLKASSYAIFINNLSHKKALEEKMKYEMEISQKLIDLTIPKGVLRLIKNGDTSEPHQLEDVPIAMFSIKFNGNDEEFEDELMIACSLFMRTANDVSQNFSNLVSKLIHEPPQWFYISGIDSQHQEDINIAITDLCHFALSVIEVYNASSTTNYSLCAYIHIGDLTIIPIPLKLPTIEILGTGFSRIKSLISYPKNGQLICTYEANEIIGTLSSFVSTKEEYEQENVYSIRRGQEPSQLEETF
ncbi:hypothetical protein TRFO_01519 [Tritrichomonas foetus]|uniref:PAS domain-containing protein n=1 Tax=Tritrichomonas foetus TaxID=1144522 RepID=A0A1J4K2V3_9EUKA|nr:hypothetical protein TRFO_01519 [Tritrichomonas foetus]|eukprot:OHT03821.1 hypothetical protein TRFO_01519 [Tritrichomonas foetus]